MTSPKLWISAVIFLLVWKQTEEINYTLLFFETVVVSLSFLSFMSSAEELSIPTPWGQISGTTKRWGSPAMPRVLAIHGLNDNAASFDQLVPLVQDQLCVVCVDLPGHGLSSHLPPGLPLSLLDYVIALRRVVDHLQWHEFSILAHSFGSHIAVYFAALFSEFVTRILLIDSFFAHIIPEEKFVLERCQVMIDKLFTTKTINVYQYEESIKKLSEGRQNKLAIHSAKALQKRAFRKSPDGYINNNDERLKLFTYPLITYDFHIGLTKGVKCPVLIISTSEFEPFLATPATEKTLTELSQRLGSKMKVVRIRGTHDVHMDQPQDVAPIVVQFFAQLNSHL